MGARQSQEQQFAPAHRPEPVVHVGWDHRVARAGGQVVRHVRNAHGLVVESEPEFSNRAAHSFSRSGNRRSGRSNHGYAPSADRPMIGVRKSRSAGDLAGAQFLAVPDPFAEQARRQSPRPRKNSRSGSKSILPNASARLKRKSQYDPTVPEIDASYFTNIRRIGQGNFGTVYRAVLNGTHHVALKVLNDGGPDLTDRAVEKNMRELVREAEVMMHLKHRNLLSIIGMTFFGDRRELSLVTDFMENGSLLDYLKKRREVFTTTRTGTITTILNSFARQIHTAMVYLEEKEVVHRDLAARNCLIGEDDVLKVGDFGLTRFTDYGLYRSTGRTPIAPRWTAPEALFASEFSSRSDVWSYGITLWELYTLGDRPFGSMPNSTLYAILKNPSDGMARYLPKPRRFCADETYTHIILLCLTHNMLMRPRFRDLQQRIHTILV